MGRRGAGLREGAEVAWASVAVLARWEPIGQRFQSGGERRCRVVSVAGRGVGSVGAGICRGIRREGGAARLRREA